MKVHGLSLLLIAALVSGCHASEPAGAPSGPASSAQAVDAAASGTALREEVYRRARERNGGKEPTKLELFNELMGKAQEQVGAVKDYGKPRVVARGGQPEVVVQGSQVLVNGKSLTIGTSSINDWRAVLGPESRSETGTYAIYLWDRYGIALSAQEKRNTVTQLEISLNLEPKEPWIPLRPDGSTKAEPPDYRPKNPFPGYLQLDGYGIDAQSKFWEIRASADPKRNLRCNSRDCSHPHGGFSNTANLYLRLNSATEYGNVYEFTISGDEELPTKSLAPR